MRVSLLNPLCSVGYVCIFRLLRNIAFNAISEEECDVECYLLEASGVSVL